MDQDVHHECNTIWYILQRQGSNGICEEHLGCEPSIGTVGQLPQTVLADNGLDDIPFQILLAQIFGEFLDGVSEHGSWHPFVM
jgi:hypothetical protein